MVPFGGFDMPVQYQNGILAEHLATRKYAGLFDISHMGRFLFSGKGALDFLNMFLTNNVRALTEPGMAQYHGIPDEKGHILDDCFLYRIGNDDYMLVVNASNRKIDLAHLTQVSGFEDLSKAAEKGNSFSFRDMSEELGMIALQGPNSERVLEDLINIAGSGKLPMNEPNRISSVKLKYDGNRTLDMFVSRTGYTGEPKRFELFVPREITVQTWENLLKVGERHGIATIGLGARDTLRLEAGLPLYGHELGLDPAGKKIPFYAVSQGRVSTRFDSGKGTPMRGEDGAKEWEFFGEYSLSEQYRVWKELLRTNGRYDGPDERFLPKLVWPIAVLNDAKDGSSNSSVRGPQEIHDKDGKVTGHSVMKIYQDGNQVGYVTSGTVVPYWRFEGEGLHSKINDQKATRAIGMAYVDAHVWPGDFGAHVQVEKAPGKFVNALIVKENMRAASPYARPVIHPEAR